MRRGERCGGIGCSSRSEWLELRCRGEEKARSLGFSGGQGVAASRRRRAETVVVGEVRRVLGGLRIGEMGARETFWDGGNGA